MCIGDVLTDSKSGPITRGRSAQRTDAEPEEITRGSSPFIYLGCADVKQRETTQAKQFDSVVVEPGGLIVEHVR